MATRPFESFRSIGDFFIRDLKPELRPLGDGPVCPVDGTLRACTDLTPGGEVIQVKGKSYTVEQLLGDADIARRCEQGQLWNFYLSPQDAHHIYSPVDGEIIETIHIPGKLWPVNDWALRSINGLFVVNERVVTIIHSAAGIVAVVMVGATNVGRIKLSYTDLVTNRAPWRRKSQERRLHNPPIATARGAKIGTFMMGSSVLLVSEFPLAPNPNCRDLKKVRYGTSLARI